MSRVRCRTFSTGSLFSAPAYESYGNLIANDKVDHAQFNLLLGFNDNRLLLAAAMAPGLSDGDWSAIARVSYRIAGL